MSMLARWSPAAAGACRRWYHAHHVTDNMQFITKHNDRIAVDPQTLSITRRVQKPICVQMNWMSAVPAQTRRYTELVVDEMDVLAVRSEVRHVLLPETGAQKIALDLLKLMTANDAVYVLYGLSIGSYLWSEAMVHAASNPQYQPALDRVAVQIWDSIANLTHTPTGIPVAVFPGLLNSKRALRWASYVCDLWYRFYLRSCHASVTAHYERAAHTFRNASCRAPALILHAKNDKVAPWEHARSIHDSWTESGIKTSWKYWDRSNHVAHYLHHPQEYRELVQTHIRQGLAGLTGVRQAADIRQGLAGLTGVRQAADIRQGLAGLTGVRQAADLPAGQSTER